MSETGEPQPASVTEADVPVEQADGLRISQAEVPVEQADGLRISQAEVPEVFPSQKTLAL